MYMSRKLSEASYNTALVRNNVTAGSSQLHYDQINSDPHAKWSARGALGASTPQSRAIGAAPRALQAGALRFFKRLQVAIFGATPTFFPVLWENYSTVTSSFHQHLTSMSHKIDTYNALKQQIHEDLRAQHPEWIESDGDCPTCDSYESRLAQLLDRLANRIRPRRTQANTKSAGVR
jgi:hypothetical protein